MKKILFYFLTAAVAFSGCGKTGSDNPGKDVDSEEKSRQLFDEDLFTKVTDESGVVSYLLKNEAVGWFNTQTNYFNTNDMTNDERFIVVLVSPNEFDSGATASKHITTTEAVVIDLKYGTKYKFSGISRSCYPYLDPETDVLYYCERNDNKTAATFYKCDLLNDPWHPTKLAAFPQKLISGGNRPLKRVCSHISLTSDKKKVFLDAWVNNEFYQGLLDLYTGEWEEWGHTPFHLTHGQMNPKDDTVALCCMDSFTDTDGKEHGMYYDPIELCWPENSKPGGGWTAADVYPRIQILTKGTRLTVKCDPERNYATHESWDATGEYVYWCSSGIHWRSMKTGVHQKLYSQTKATHCFFSKDNNYVTFDDNSLGYYRGCLWKVAFFNRKTQKMIYIHSLLPKIAEKENESQIHPDPHPHFVCNDKYVVCTAATGDGKLHASITPVDQLIQMTK